MNTPTEQFPRQGRRWTDDENAVVMDAALRSSAWKYAARKLGRTETAIVQRARTLRLAGIDVPRKSRSHERRAPWTTAQRERLRQGLKAREPIRAIAKDLGRSVSSVASEAWRLGAPKAYNRHRPHEIRRWATEAISMSQRGDSLKEIAADLGVSVTTARRWCKDAGHNPGRWRRREYSLADLDRIRAGYKRGESVKEIADALGRTPASVRMRARKLGVTPIRKALRRPWTKAEVVAAMAEYESGMTYAEVGDAHGRTRASVKSALDSHRRRQ